MPTSIVIVRADLSIVGAEETASEDQGIKEEGVALFDILGTQSLDLIVLDCREPRGDGCAAMGKIRARTHVPILAICDVNDAAQANYLESGAVECLISPFDVTTFGNVIHRITAEKSRPITSKILRKPTYTFSGMDFNPALNRLTGQSVSVELTALENILLTMLAEHPGEIQTRAELIRALYGTHPPVNDRAIDVVVARLRQKLAAVRGEDAQKLIKTEFRRGYVLVCDVALHVNNVRQEVRDSRTETVEPVWTKQLDGSLR